MGGRLQRRPPTYPPSTRHSTCTGPPGTHLLAAIRPHDHGHLPMPLGSTAACSRDNGHSRTDTGPLPGHFVPLGSRAFEWSRGQPFHFVCCRGSRLPSHAMASNTSWWRGRPARKLYYSCGMLWYGGPGLDEARVFRPLPQASCQYLETGRRKEEETAALARRRLRRISRLVTRAFSVRAPYPSPQPILDTSLHLWCVPVGRNGLVAVGNRPIAMP